MIVISGQSALSRTKSAPTPGAPSIDVEENTTINSTGILIRGFMISVDGYAVYEFHGVLVGREVVA
jgi:hypothetical protein